MLGIKASLLCISFKNLLNKPQRWLLWMVMCFLTNPVFNGCRLNEVSAECHGVKIWVERVGCNPLSDAEQ